MTEIEEPETEKPVINTTIKLSGSILLILYFLLCIGFGSLLYTQTGMKNQPKVSQPTIIAPTPQILVRYPEHEWQIQFEDFSTNIHEWTLIYSLGKVELINGKMILQSYFKNGGILATTYSENSQFEPSEDVYYVQADFSTDTSKSSGYGLVFGLDKYLGTFYLFQINPQSKKLILYKYTAGGFVNLFSKNHFQLHSYPEPNTLSVYFSKGEIELYANGELINTLIDDNPLNSRGVGAFISDSSARLIVDNFFTYDDKK